MKLGPYDIVTFEVWDYIMPYWLESIRTELTLKEREEVMVPLRFVVTAALTASHKRLAHFWRFYSVIPFI